VAGVAELCRPPQRGHGDVDGASAPCSRSGVFEFARKLLVRSADECGAVPHAAVGIEVERGCKGLDEIARGHPEDAGG
jgi:hypothetical protein